VLIVGAGPAGSTAARLLATGGARVCLVDKARFPRPKPCGGALSPRTLRYLPSGVDRVVRARVRRAVFTFRSGKPFEIASSAPMGYMVCREEFDAWLRAGAEEAGVSVRDGASVRAIEETEIGFTVRAGGEAISAGTVIGADGANSLVASQCLPGRPAARYLAVETEVPQDGYDLGDTVLVDVGAYPGGYAWAFPMGDHINVGVLVEYARGRSCGARRLRRQPPGFRDRQRPGSGTGGRTAVRRCPALGRVLLSAMRLTWPIHFSVKGSLCGAERHPGGAGHPGEIGRAETAPVCRSGVSGSGPT
jgi:geranylgeranyl reductase family protein